MYSADLDFNYCFIVPLLFFLILAGVGLLRDILLIKALRIHIRSHKSQELKKQP